MRKRAILTAYFVLLMSTVYSQSIDSLSSLIENETRNHEKIDLMSELIDAYNKQGSNLYEQTGEKAIELAYEINDTLRVIKILEQLGEIYSQKSNSDRAIHFFERAEKYASKIKNDSIYANLLNFIGSELSTQGKFEKALKKYLKALDISKNTQDTIALANNIGIIYSNIGQYDKAVKYYNIAMKTFDSTSYLEDKSIILNNLAIIYVDEYNKPDSAIIYLKQALKISEQINDQEGIVSTYLNIGFAYTKQNRYNKAIKYILKADSMSSKINDLEIKYQVSFDLGQIYSLKNNYDSSYFYLKNALKISRKINSIYLTKDTYEELSKTTFQNKKYELSCIYKDSLLKYIDSINYLQIEKQITEIGTKYETDKIQKENKIHKLQIEKQKQYSYNQKVTIYSLSVIAILILIFSVIIFKQFRTKTKFNNELKIQHKEILQKNEEISVQKEKILSQRDIVMKKNKDINDSINYASRIQNSLLPSQRAFSENLSQHFILYKPKDIVSGDFYYLKKVKNQLIVAVADCTGHGVPGAFVSMLGIAFLNEIIAKPQALSASEILEQLRSMTKNTLKQTQAQNRKTTKDGMDIALCLIDTKNMKLQYSGAHSPLYISRNNEIIEIKATRNPIGVYLKETPFINNEISFFEDDVFYIFSDGYADQLGGEKNKKFMKNNFKNLLVDISKKPLDKQKLILDETIKQWQNHNVQNDDILVIGFKVDRNTQ